MNTDNEKLIEDIINLSKDDDSDDGLKKEVKTIGCVKCAK